jgi:hypothetical protein
MHRTWVTTLNIDNSSKRIYNYLSSNSVRSFTPIIVKALFICIWTIDVHMSTINNANNVW